MKNRKDKSILGRCASSLWQRLFVATSVLLRLAKRNKYRYVRARQNRDRYGD